MSAISPYPPFGLPAAGFLGNATPVNVSLPVWIGLCSAGAITNPGWVYPVNPFEPQLITPIIQDWGTGTIWLWPVNLKWTGSAWTFFNTFYVDTKGKYSYFGNQENGSTGTQRIISSFEPLQPPTTSVQGHLFADLPDLLAIGIGVNVNWNGSFYACAVSLTQFTPYNNQAPIAKSGAVFPVAPPQSGIVTAGTTPVPPYQTLNNSGVNGGTRTPFVVQLGKITYTGPTPTGFFGNGQFYFSSQPFFIGMSRAVNLLSVATADDYATAIGSQSGPSAVANDRAGQGPYPPANSLALVETPNPFGASGYCVWPCFILQSLFPQITTVANWVPVGKFGGSGALYPCGWFDATTDTEVIGPTSYAQVKLGGNNLYVWCLGG